MPVSDVCSYPFYVKCLRSVYKPVQLRPQSSANAVPLHLNCNNNWRQGCHKCTLLPLMYRDVKHVLETTLVSVAE